MTSPETLSLEDRQTCLRNIEGLQLSLSLIAHRLISDPRDPLPATAWDSFNFAFINLVPVTKTWVN